MTDGSPANPTRQAFIQLGVAAVVMALAAAAWFGRSWFTQDWPVVTATLSNHRVVRVDSDNPSKRGRFLHVTMEFDRATPSGLVKCKLEDYRIGPATEPYPSTMRISVNPDSCLDPRIAR